MSWVLAERPVPRLAMGMCRKGKVLTLSSLPCAGPEITQARLGLFGLGRLQQGFSGE